MGAPFDVVIFEPSAMFLDLVFTGLPSMPKLGAEIFAEQLQIAPGGAYNTAAVLAKLGKKVALVTQIGTDLISRYLEHELEQVGVCTDYLMRVDGNARAITVSLTYPKDRAFVSFEDRPEHYAFPETLLSPTMAKCLFFARMPKDPRMLALGRKAKAAGLMLATDMHLPWGTVADAKVAAALSMCDLILPNAVEARFISGARSVSQALNRLSAIAPTVIKDGPKGSLAKIDGKPVRVGGLTVKAVDTTGAGDCFNAGFLAGIIDGVDWPQAMARGNVCAGQAVTKAGATTAAPDAATLDRLLKTHYGYRYRV